jgi:anti-sigma regulatory factor (Ser/Thr protein kinase)
LIEYSHKVIKAINAKINVTSEKWEAIVTALEEA